VGRGGDEKAGRVHELHDEERDDGDGNGDVGLSLTMDPPCALVVRLQLKLG